jgi:hypothetical protein
MAACVSIRLRIDPPARPSTRCCSTRRGARRRQAGILPAGASVSGGRSPTGGSAAGEGLRGRQRQRSKAPPALPYRVALRRRGESRVGRRPSTQHSGGRRSNTLVHLRTAIKPSYPFSMRSDELGDGRGREDRSRSHLHRPRLTLLATRGGSPSKATATVIQWRVSTGGRAGELPPTAPSHSHSFSGLVSPSDIFRWSLSNDQRFGP